MSPTAGRTSRSGFRHPQAANVGFHDASLEHRSVVAHAETKTGSGGGRPRSKQRYAGRVASRRSRSVPLESGARSCLRCIRAATPSNDMPPASTVGQANPRSAGPDSPPIAIGRSGPGPRFLLGTASSSGATPADPTSRSDPQRHPAGPHLPTRSTRHRSAKVRAWTARTSPTRSTEGGRESPSTDPRSSTPSPDGCRPSCTTRSGRPTRTTTFIP